MTERNKPATHRLTQAMENYLLSIFVVQERGSRVTNPNLVEQLRRVPASENLGTSLPAVSGMLRRMERENLIRLSDTRDIDLTTKGRQLAESMIRKHRLAARLVVDLLGVPLHEVDAEAHMLEHALSETLEKRIQDRLGRPQTDPFGQPIPGSGYREPRNVVTLDKAQLAGTVGCTEHIPFVARIKHTTNLTPLFMVFGAGSGAISTPKFIKISINVGLSWKSGDMRFDR